MNQIFLNKYYNTFIYIAISLTIFLIFLSMFNIIDKSKLFTQENNKIKKITGYIVDDNLSQEQLINQTSLEGEVYTENSYLVYYLLLGFLGLCVFILTIIFFLPKIKDLS